MFKKILEALRKMSPKLLESIDVSNITEEEVISIFESVLVEAKEKKSDKVKVIEAILAKMKDKKIDEAEKLLKEMVGEEMSDEELIKCDDADLTPEQKKKKAELLKTKQVPEDAVAKEAKKKQDELEQKNKDIESRFDAMDKKLKQRECKEMLEMTLSEANLPEPIKNKIRNSFKDKLFKEADLKESVKSEQDTLAQLVESGATFNLGDGGSGSFVEREPVTRLQDSMDLMLGYVPTAEEKKDQYKDIDGFTSLREA